MSPLHHESTFCFAPRIICCGFFQLFKVLFQEKQGSLVLDSSLLWASHPCSHPQQSTATQSYYGSWASKIHTTILGCVDMSRILQPEGAFICVSFAPPEQRLELLEYWDLDDPEKCLAWDVHVDAIGEYDR